MPQQTDSCMLCGEYFPSALRCDMTQQHVKFENNLKSATKTNANKIDDCQYHNNLKY